MFLNYENGTFTKNTYINANGYFCMDLIDFLESVEGGIAASIHINDSVVSALEDGSILSGISQDTAEDAYNAIVYG